MMPSRPLSLLSWSSCLVTVLLAGCGASAPTEEWPTLTDEAPITDAARRAETPPIARGDAGEKPKAAGTETACNGIDDDQNGVVDDVDVGNDGICDCLKVGLLGAPGTAGVGDVFHAWLSARSSAGVAELGAQVLTPELLGPLQIVVAQDVRNGGRVYAPSEVAALEAWIKKGGGFMTLTGFADPSENANVNTLLGPHGISYGTQPILYVGGSTMPVTGWVAHPVTEGITRIGADNGYAVLGAGTAIAREGGYDVLRALDVGAGHVLVWGDEWITFDSEWKGHTEYQVERFWLNTLKWLTKAGQCQVPLPGSVK